MLTLPKAFIFGTGTTGKSLISKVSKQYQVMGFFDNDVSKWGGDIEGFPIYNPNLLVEMDYDVVIIASFTGLAPITKQLMDLGVRRENIISEHVALSVESRVVFLEKLAILFEDESIQGCVAEGGVLQVEFAKEINRVFPTRKFYLFDTFSGFDERDISIEKKHFYSESDSGHFNITSEELVKSKLTYPDVCIIRKGYFPDSTKGINEAFCFVNLDFDLYQPTLSGLEYFIPRMVKGGVILIHDYFSEGYKGVKEAVKDFGSKNGKLPLFPIGDGLSIGIYCLYN